MSNRRAKKLRKLHFHAEYGAYYPAVFESERELAKYKPTEREKRRLEQMTECHLLKLANMLKGAHLKYPFCPTCGDLRGDFYPGSPRLKCLDPFHADWLED